MRWRSLTRSRWARGAAVVALALIVVAVVASFFVDEPMRRRIESDMNARMKGYHAHIRKLDFHPFGFSLDLYDVVMTQDAAPDPPVLRVPRLSASVQWRALLHARLVANFRLEHPIVYVTRTHAEKEAKDPTPVSEHGWQRAVEAIYPLKINEFRVVQAKVTYVDDPRSKPLELTDLDILAGNIRNIWSPDRVYPSDLSVKGVIFGRGRIAVDGNANFLAEPFPGVKAHLKAEEVALDYFRPVLARYNVTMHQGVLAAEGDVEYAPKVKTLTLDRVVLDRARVDYVHRAETQTAEKQRAQTVKESAQSVSNEPGVLLKVADLRVHGNLAYVNEAKDQAYRVTLDDMDFSVKNFSNHFEEGPAQARLTGKFMGTGPTTALGTFRPEAHGPDFNLDVKIENTDMRAMNDLLRAYGKFDVVAGLFSFYSELRVKNGRVEGYVKPLFREMQVYDKRQDQDKSKLHKLYERVIGGLAKLLENVPRAEVATRTKIHGPVESPKADTMQTIVGLVENAFFKAILPGFENELGRPGHGLRRVAKERD